MKRPNRWWFQGVDGYWVIHLKEPEPHMFGGEVPGWKPKGIWWRAKAAAAKDLFGITSPKRHDDKLLEFDLSKWKVVKVWELEVVE